MSNDSIQPEQLYPVRARGSGVGQASRGQWSDVLVELNTAGNGGTPRLTVVVPTRNEQCTIELLLTRLGPVVAPLHAEIVVVDDSDDATPDVLATKAASCPVPVRLLHRS